MFGICCIEAVDLKSFFCCQLDGFGRLIFLSLDGNEQMKMTDSKLGCLQNDKTVICL